MDYKEKYEKLEKFIKDLYPFMSDYYKEKTEGMIPELKESNDELIIKDIISYLKYKHSDPDVAYRKYDKWIAWLEKQKPTDKIEQVSAWSEEDERMFSGLNSIVEDWYNTMSEKEKEYYGDCGYINWLKSLKDRIQLQPKQEWSKEDNKMLNNVIQRIKDLDHYWNKPTDEKMIDWLKSLKPHWKPSEYDISLLEELARNIRNNVRPFCSEVSALEDLIKNIKTL